ncbi:hypothetical protein COUCH_22545 [Couchioplanes caeruleus]|uniref:hypothetical protein n=1 Tax=Couchioplanes caeruleus TaxID=56438 RepID=UPI0020BF89E0|nr:hypothetical protein [Couchioplanes caeruleus]UQU61821.1 hypothetical protein COUCH_22545 [Couchioplanes caeruleus]
MCGSVSAIGLHDRERLLWPYLRERLRVPEQLMSLQRGVLGDAEVAVVAAVTPQGRATIMALLASTEEIAQEILLPAGLVVPPGQDRIVRAKVGDYDADILVRSDPHGAPEPLAVLTTPWIEQHLLLYARDLWHRR